MAEGRKTALGTQGFAFDDCGSVHPAGTPKTAYLEQYARHFATVEIDSTFYGLPGPGGAGLAERTPDGFRFALFPKLITHDKKLQGAQGDAGPLWGPCRRWATPSCSRCSSPTTSPRTATCWRPFWPTYQGRAAVELRNRGWLNPDLAERLSQHNVALVLQDLHYMPKLTGSPPTSP
jgi:uncharacterized protein YecE (DUF72 family)